MKEWFWKGVHKVRQFPQHHLTAHLLSYPNNNHNSTTGKTLLDLQTGELSSFPGDKLLLPALQSCRTTNEFRNRDPSVRKGQIYIIIMLGPWWRKQKAEAANDSLVMRASAEVLKAQDWTEILCLLGMCTRGGIESGNLNEWQSDDVQLCCSGDDLLRISPCLIISLPNNILSLPEYIWNEISNLPKYLPVACFPLIRQRSTFYIC